MRRKHQELRSAYHSLIENLESRLLLSIGLLSSDTDIGSPTQAGSAAFSNGSYTITAGGAGIGGISDQFNFAFQNNTGNVTISTEVNSLTNSSSIAQAGLMIRNDSTAASAFVGIFITPSNGIELMSRSTDGGAVSQLTYSGIHAPEYLELALSGTTVTAYYASAGASWSEIGSPATITLGSTTLIGLAAAADNTSAQTTAVFSALNILPTNWSDNDIGSPPLPGGAGYNSTNNIFTAIGSGAGVGGASDQFNFANYSITGNASVTAQVDSQTNANSAAAAGVMIRADTTATSLFADVELTPQSTVTFVGRSATGVFTSSPVSVTGPVFLNVTDLNNVFTGYYSSDGVNWVQIGASQTIAMPSATVLGGIAVSSNNASAVNTAAFSNVDIVRGAWNDSDIGSPAFPGSAVYDAPSDTTTINGNGSDIYGNADQFNFDSTTMAGNGSVIAYIDSITNTNAWAKAGVMIRNDTTAGSPFTAVLVSPTSGITFEWRTTENGAVSQEISSPAGGPTPAPVGLELTRSGNTFTAYYSTDGINWMAVGAGQAVSLNTTALAGLAVTSHNTAAICTATFSSVSVGSSPPPGAGIYSSTDQLFLNDLELREVLFYYDESNATTGLAPDTAYANGGSTGSASSIASDGFDLTALTIGDARGWLTHAQAYQRALTTIDFLYNSGANVNGFYYHFLNANGTRNGTSEVSSVDTAELMAGVLTAAQYWAGTPLQTTAVAMFNRVDWAWMQQTSGVFYGAWTPESGFSGSYGDFSEAALLYLLGLGSPTYPTSVASWYSWSRTPVETYSGYKYVEADDAALFTEQYPQAWFDLQGLTDAKGLNYYTNSQNATLAQRQYQINLSSTYSDYGPNMWGLTPAEGVNGYTVWGGPPANGPIDGTVVPTGPGGSLEFTPRDSINALEYMKQTYPATYLKYGFVDAFNPLKNYTSNLVLGIDVGMTLVSAENSRSNLVWNTFSQSSVAQQALAKAFPVAGTAVWAVNGSGNWNTAANWTTGVIPNSAGAVAELLDITPPDHTVYSDISITAGTIHFNSASEYAITGAGSLTLQSTGGNSALVEVDQGTDEINLPLTLASNTTFNVAAGATLIIGNPMTVNSGVTLTQTGAGTVIYESIINVASGGSINFAASASVQSLSVAAGATADVTGAGTVLELGNLSNYGTLNLQNNILLINYAGSADPIATVKAEVQSGYAGGTWTGPGITSTAAQNNSASYGIGYADSADPGNPAGLAPDTVEIKYTLLGDANLDGKVNSIDLAILNTNFNQAVTGWDQGDFNYDGADNSIDYAVLASNFNKRSNAAAAVMPVTAATIFASQSATVATPTPVAAAVTPASNVSDSNLVDQNQTNGVSAAVLDPQKKTGHALRQGNHHSGA